MQLNASRIKFLQAQDDVVNAMKESASKELLRVSEDKNAYKRLLKGLIVQVFRIWKDSSYVLPVFDEMNWFLLSIVVVELRELRMHFL